MMILLKKDDILVKYPLFKAGLCLLIAINSRYNDQCLDLSIILVLVKIRSVSEQLMLVSS